MAAVVGAGVEGGISKVPFVDKVVDMPVVATTGALGAVLGQGGDMPVVATTGQVLRLWTSL